VFGRRHSLAAIPLFWAIVATGIGGVMRDVLVNEIPVVLRADLYALAALAGAAVVVGGHLLHGSPTAATIAGAILCFVIRLVAIRRGWSLLSHCAALFVRWTNEASSRHIIRDCQSPSRWRRCAQHGLSV
jgi:uncharacterized membrane protein YeiH